MMRIVKMAAMFLATGLAACGGDTTNTTVISCKPSLWNGATPVQPPCTVAVNLVVDDTANGVYLDREAQWKGAFQYDAATRIAYYDGSWNGGNGPFAPLYDDGPWTAGGHEPIGQVANDHILGVTMFMFPPESGTMTVGYGLVDHAFGDGWIWVGPDGSFQVEAGRTTPVNATGMAFAPFGTTDVALFLDTNNLATGTWSTSTVGVKGSGWAWNVIAMRDDGVAPDSAASDGIYTFVLSEHSGAGKTYYHAGLANSGQVIQFVFMLGGTEYKVSTIPPTTGVSAQTKLAAAGSWAAATVANQSTGDQNTYITAPTY